MSGYLSYLQKTRQDGATIGESVLSQLAKGYSEDKSTSQHLFYPQDLFTPECAPFILFFAVDPTEPMVILDKIALYMPRGIGASYGIQYGTMTDEIQRAYDVASSIGDSLGGAKNQLGLEGLGVSLGAAYQAARAGGGITGATEAGLRTAGRIMSNGNRIGQNLSQHAKTLLNPHQAILFEGVQFRQHTFSFDLVARNAKESETINDIIYKFKWHAHPKAQNGTRQDTFWNWPSNFNIGLFSPARKYLYKISTSVLSSILVEEMAGGTRAFFGETGAAVARRLTMTFIETELMTRDRIKDGF